MSHLTGLQLKGLCGNIFCGEIFPAVSESWPGFFVRRRNCMDYICDNGYVSASSMRDFVRDNNFGLRGKITGAIILTSTKKHQGNKAL